MSYPLFFSIRPFSLLPSILGVLCICAGISTAVAQGLNSTAQGLSPFGEWYTEQEEAKIKLYSCGTKLCGKVIGLKEPNDDQGNPKRDLYNPDPSKRNRSAIGIDVILGLTPDKDAWKGEIYNASDGKKYTASFTMLDANHARIEGCVLKIFCKSQNWTKIN